MREELQGLDLFGALPAPTAECCARAKEPSNAHRLGAVARAGFDPTEPVELEKRVRRCRVRLRATSNDGGRQVLEGFSDIHPLRVFVGASAIRVPVKRRGCAFMGVSVVGQEGVRHGFSEVEDASEQLMHHKISGQGA